MQQPRSNPSDDCDFDSTSEEGVALLEIEGLNGNHEFVKTNHDWKQRCQESRCGMFVLLLMALLGSVVLFSVVELTMDRQHMLHHQCDCTTTTLRQECCERVIFRAHKFGTVLLGDLFQSLRHAQHGDAFHIDTRPVPHYENTTTAASTPVDYRHVMVTRNWFEGIVSGYLYHKAGYECTLEIRGQAAAHHSSHYDMERHYHNKFWDTQHLQYHDVYNLSYPPRHNRSLCEYLQQESEQEGMKVIMDIALSRWYKGMVAYHHAHNATGKSLFLCYENLVDPFQQQDVYYQILEFLFPHVERQALPPMPGNIKAQLQRQQVHHSVYTGGHATGHDPVVRARLRRMVERFDKELFGHVIAQSSVVFGCGKEEKHDP